MKSIIIAITLTILLFSNTIFISATSIELHRSSNDGCKYSTTNKLITNDKVVYSGLSKDKNNKVTYSKDYIAFTYDANLPSVSFMVPSMGGKVAVSFATKKIEQSVNSKIKCGLYIHDPAYRNTYTKIYSVYYADEYQKTVKLASGSSQASTCKNKTGTSSYFSNEYSKEYLVKTDSKGNLSTTNTKKMYEIGVVNR